MTDTNEIVEDKNTEVDTVAVPTTTVMTEVPTSWIKITDGKFICSECENEVEPETNTIEGVVKADLDQIKMDLGKYPTKVIYGACPVCGMEFVFRHKEGDLYLEPSDMEK
jgi:hypothetical protein